MSFSIDSCATHSQALRRRKKKREWIHKKKMETRWKVVFMERKTGQCGLLQEKASTCGDKRGAGENELLRRDEREMCP